MEISDYFKHAHPSATFLAFQNYFTWAFIYSLYLFKAIEFLNII